MAARRAGLGVAFVLGAAVVVVGVVTACSDFTTAATDPGDSSAPDASVSSDVGAGDGAAIAEPEQDAMASAPPEIVVDKESRLGRLVVGPANVYYTQDSGQGAILRVDKTANNANGSVVSPPISPTDIALVGSTLYATSLANKAVMAFDTAQPGSVASTKGVTAPGAVVADAMAIVFLETTGGNAGAYSLAPNFVAAPLQLTTGSGPAAVAMDAHSVYATFGPHVQRYMRAGGSPATTVASGAANAAISVVEIGGDTLYLASGSEVLMLPAFFGAGQAPTKLHEYGIGAEVTAIRATATDLFVATQGALAGGTVHRLPLPGAAGISSVVSRIKDTECKLPDMVVDETSIYFLCNSAAGAGSVWRVARPAK